MIAIVVLAALALTAPPVPAAGGISRYFYSFHTTVAPWKAATDHGIFSGLERYGDDEACFQDIVGGYARLKSELLYTDTDAVPHPIATWMVASFPAFSPVIHVSVEWMARSSTECNSCVSAAYVGNHAPSTGGEIHTVPGVVTDNWQRFRYESTVAVGTANKVYVALGWMGTDAALALDCVSVVTNP
jgi:hypothetical protein